MPTAHLSDAFCCRVAQGCAAASPVIDVRVASEGVCRMCHTKKTLPLPVRSALQHPALKVGSAQRWMCDGSQSSTHHGKKKTAPNPPKRRMGAQLAVIGACVCRAPAEVTAPLKVKPGHIVCWDFEVVQNGWTCVYAGQMMLEVSPMRSALQRSVLGVRSSALD